MLQVNSLHVEIADNLQLEIDQLLDNLLFSVASETFCGKVFCQLQTQELFYLRDTN